MTIMTNKLYDHSIIFCGTRPRSCIYKSVFINNIKTLKIVKNRKLCFFITKKNVKKVTMNSNFTEFSRNPEWSITCDRGLKRFLNLSEFFFVLGFFKTDFKLLSIKKCRVVLTPLGSARVWLTL